MLTCSPSELALNYFVKNTHTQRDKDLPTFICGSWCLSVCSGRGVRWGGGDGREQGVGFNTEDAPLFIEKILNCERFHVRINHKETLKKQDKKKKP